MKQLATLVLLAAWLLPAWTSSAQDRDPIKQALDQARTARDRKLEAAKEKLETAIEARLAEAAAKSDLPTIKKLEEQKAAFRDQGELPVGAAVAKARLTYDDEIRAARVEWQKALVTAKTAYTKERKVAQAEAVEAEIQETAPKTYRKPVKEPPPSDPITGQWQIAIGERQYEADRVRTLNVRLDPGGATSMPGMFWRKGDAGGYTLVFPRGQTGKVRLGRAGEQFDGRMTDGKRIHGSRKI